MFEFNAETRAQLGSAAARRIRASQKVPGIVYGPDTQPISITMSHNQLYQLMKNEKFHSSIVSMMLEGKKQPVLLRDFQFHPYKPQLMHIDFQMVSDKREIHMTVPLHFVNAENAPGVKLGHGIASHIMVEVNISCMPKDLPSFIEVDMGALNVGQSIHVRDLKLPTGVKLALSTKENPVVAAILAPIKEEAPSAVVAAATPAEAIPAKGGDAKAAPAKADAKTDAKPAAKK